MSRRTKSTSTSLVPLDAPTPLPGSVPLRNDGHERFAFKRATLMPKADAYRQAGFAAKDDHAASGNASKLERRADVAARIAYLRRQDEQILANKRDRIEGFLWSIHESNVAKLWETVEVDCLDKQGKPILSEDGEPLKKKVQRPRLLSELSEDVQRTIETCGIDENGRIIPKPYSKMTANAELRKLLGIGVVTGRDESDLSRMSDGDLIATLAEQARELGISIDLSYNFGEGDQ
jgi:hypothetical protein